MKDYEFALELAVRAHRGSKDKAGKDYIGHPLAVADMVDTEEEKVIALLHDVVEDTDISLDSLRTLFGDTIADAVGLLTHDAAVPYFEYIEMIRTDPLATKIKLADLAHNSDTSRLASITEADRARFAKYTRALEILKKQQTL